MFLGHCCNTRQPLLLRRRQLLRLATRLNGAAARRACNSEAPEWRKLLPFANNVDFDGEQLPPSRVLSLLSDSVTPKRLERINAVVANRTYDVVPVVEGLFDMGNLAAVCRSTDALGFGALQVITKGAQYKHSQRTSAGADKWLHVTSHDTTQAALRHLRASGFQIVVTHLGPSSVSIQEVDWTRPTAVVMGNEAAGVSAEAVAAADVCAVIPMGGFVESFNISVAAALVLYEARRQRQSVRGRAGDLSPEEQEALRAHLVMRAMKNPDNVLRLLLSRPPPVWQAPRVKAGLRWQQQQREQQEQQQQQQQLQESSGSCEEEDRDAAQGVAAGAAGAVADATGSATPAQGSTQRIGVSEPPVLRWMANFVSPVMAAFMAAVMAVVSPLVALVSRLTAKRQ